MKVTKKLIASILEIVIGIILTILGYTGIADSYWSGMGTALITVGVIFLFRTFRYKKDTEYKEKVDVEGEPENHDLVEVVEKLTEELNALKARVLALETPAEEVKEEKEEAPVAEVGCDDKQERINNIYKNIMQPLARVSIGAPKAATSKTVHTVDYKAFKSFIND